MFNRKSAAAAFIALSALAAGSAHAGNVQWSVSVNLPPVGTVVSNVPVYSAPAYQVPVYHVPAPVYRAPVPMPVPPQVVYRPAPSPVVVYRPVPVVDYRGWDRGHYHHHHGPHGHYREERRDDRRGGDRWEPGPRQRHH